jgi:hypothetical protein
MMKDRKEKMEALMAWKGSACLIFSGSVVLCALIGALRGEGAVPSAMIASLAIVSALGAFLKMVAFSETFIKNMRYTMRMAIFVVPFFAMMCASSYWFNWLPKEFGAWTEFAGIFLVVFAGASVGFEIYYRVVGRKYDGLLGEYRKKREREKEVGDEQG